MRKSRINPDQPLTQKQESAVQHYALYGNKSAAYQFAFNTKKTGSHLSDLAWTTFKKPHMKKRLEILRQQASDDYLVTKDILARELDEARQLAIETETPAAAVAASTAKAKLYGLMIDKVQQQVAISDGQSLLPQKIIIEVVHVDKKEISQEPVPPENLDINEYSVD